MKKWEIAVIVGFFAVFLILFFSVKPPWEAETFKIGETKLIDDVGILPDSLLVSDKLDIEFRNYGKIVGYNNYGAGNGWKFVILDIFVLNQAKENKTFSPGWIEDENGIRYNGYYLEDVLEGTPYNSLYPYKHLVMLSPGGREWFSIAYKMPVNAVPEKIHFFINSNSHASGGEVMLKK